MTPSCTPKSPTWSGQNCKVSKWWKGGMLCLLCPQRKCFTKHESMQNVRFAAHCSAQVTLKLTFLHWWLSSFSTIFVFWFGKGSKLKLTGASYVSPRLCFSLLKPATVSWALRVMISWEVYHSVTVSHPCSQTSTDQVSSWSEWTRALFTKDPVAGAFD